jgi:hypothetical protein
MRNYYTCFYALLIFILSGCATMNESSKYQFVDGIYKTKVLENQKTRVYVDVAEDSIAVFRLGSRKQAFKIDTLQLVSIAFPAIQDDSLFSPYNFTQRSFDLDMLTIPFKYRPEMAALTNQLNTNFNGACM